VLPLLGKKRYGPVSPKRTGPKINGIKIKKKSKDEDIPANR
jgi:hypothetical protein